MNIGEKDIAAKTCALPGRKDSRGGRHGAEAPGRASEEGDAEDKGYAGEVAIDDLPECYRQLALIVGLENAVRLSEFLGGLTVYFQKPDTLIKGQRDRAIRREFTGLNHRELARRYGLTEQRIRGIVKRCRG